MPPLTVEQLRAHPAYKHLEWKMPATRSGYATVAHGRRGGPFRLWYEIHGSGPTRLVFIMGLAAYRTAWKRQTRYFAHDKARADQYSVLVFDNRGMAKSDKPSTRYSTSEMAQDVVDLLEEIGWLPASATPWSPEAEAWPFAFSKRQQQQQQQKKNAEVTTTTTAAAAAAAAEDYKVNIIGVSLGGMIAQELGLLLPPGTVNSLILCSTAPRVVSAAPFLENLRQRASLFIPQPLDVQIQETADRLFTPDFLAAPDTEADEPFSGGPEGGNFPTIRDRYCAIEVDKRFDKAGFTPKGFLLQLIAAGWHNKSPERLAELAYRVGRNRIAVCHGTKDNMLGFHHAKLLQQELGEGIEFRVWEGAGHVLLWEVESEFTPWLEEFINRERK